MKILDSGKWGPDHWNIFRERLEKAYIWPALYVFKFIVPVGQTAAVRLLFPMHQPEEKASGKGNYTSLTYRMMMPGSDAIIEVYQRVKNIEGLIAL
jgi:hypothetical protein